MALEFDELSKALARGLPRREVLRRIGSGLASAALTTFSFGKANAAPSPCAVFCSGQFPPGPRRASCQQACRQCNADVSRVCFGATNTICCPPGGSCCGSSTGAVFCCPPETSCCFEICCPVDQPCCFGADGAFCCPPETSCCDGICCPSGTFCDNGECVEVGFCATGGTCDNAATCDPNRGCVCFQTVEGDAFCHLGQSCEGSQPCVSSADCPPGFACSAVTCCGPDPICINPCDAEGAAISPQNGGPTTTGR
jgi:hypothetical protein